MRREAKVDAGKFSLLASIVVVGSREHQKL